VDKDGNYVRDASVSLFIVLGYLITMTGGDRREDGVTEQSSLSLSVRASLSYVHAKNSRGRGQGSSMATTAAAWLPPATLFLLSHHPFFRIARRAYDLSLSESAGVRRAGRGEMRGDRRNYSFPETGMNRRRYFRIPIDPQLSKWH